MKYIPHFLLAAYVVVFTWGAIAPYSRDVWYVENLPIMAIVIALAVLWLKGVRFSSTSYILMSFLIFIHTIGGHYTFERVPFDWFNDLFGFERNMYDRVGHFTVGFYAYPVIEYIKSKNLVNTNWIAYLFPIFLIMAVAVAYEWIEWIYAVVAGGEAGADFLGSQGDIWDAQKDMLMDTLGAMVALAIYKLSKNNLPT